MNEKCPNVLMDSCAKRFDKIELKLDKLSVKFSYYIGLLTGAGAVIGFLAGKLL